MNPPGTRPPFGQAQHGGLEEQFPVGCQVVLKFCPDSLGEVVGYKRGRVRVFWPDWRRAGAYFGCSLILESNHRKEKSSWTRC